MRFHRSDRLAFVALPGLLQNEVRNCGEWLIGRIVAEADRLGTPLTSWDTWVLEHDLDTALSNVAASWSMIRRFAPQDGERLTAALADGTISSATTTDPTAIVAAFADTIDRCVTLARSVIEQDTAAGAQSVRFGRGRTVPADWASRYDVIAVAGLPWTIVSVVGSAFDDERARRESSRRRSTRRSA